MDRRFWEKIIPASVLAVGIALAGYFVGGGYIVVGARVGIFVVDRLSGAVHYCRGYGSSHCVIVPRAGASGYDAAASADAASAADFATDAAAVPQ